ncbi:unnamed protein product [Ectocarpus fasciculatus]
MESLKEQIAGWPQFSYVQALAGWFVIWAALVSIPPGHTEQKNVIRMNMAHGVVATSLAVLTILTGCDSTFSTAASVAFFAVDALVMISNGRRQKRLGEKLDSPARGMDYAHHLIGAVYGTFLLFGQQVVCQPSCPAPNLYTYAQTNEFSTPFYGLYRLTRHPVAGGLFALAFFGSRIVFNFMYLVPYSWSHCTFSGFMVIAAPYQLLQVVWMFLIMKKVAASLTGGSKPKADKVA